MSNVVKRPPVWRAWLLLAVACWAGVAPAVAMFAPDLASGFARCGAENRVWNFLTDSAKPRSENSAQVTAAHRENTACDYEPASGLTIYANGDPLNISDPSGNMSLLEINAVADINGILDTIVMGQRIIGYINKVKTMVDLIVGMRQLLSGLGGELSGKDWKKMIPGPKIPSLGDAAVAFGDLAAEGFLLASANWVTGYMSYLAQGKPIDAYLIYLPTFISWAKETNISSGAKVGGKPVKLVAGAFGLKKIGSLLGLGVSAGKRNLQLLRMDYHVFDDKHGGTTGLKDGELSILHQGNYHMHVYGWNHFTN